MNKKISEMLNTQVNEELVSAYIYYSFASELEYMGLNGYAKWYIIQAKEELEHAKRIFDYLVDNGEKVMLKDIYLKKTPEDLKGILELGLNHEKHITECIHKIYKEALDEKDFATVGFLYWFVIEQVEEEKNAHELMSKYMQYKDNIYELDKEAGKRE